MDKFDIFFLGVLIGGITGIIILGFTDDSPRAIDVYRGKTTLEITSVNDIPTDTVVVFKNK